MTVVGIHTIVDGVTSYARGLLSSDGGLWLILIDGPLLIPLGVAAFFYPVAAALTGAAIAAATIGGVMLWRTGFMHITHEPAREAHAWRR